MYRLELVRSGKLTYTYQVHFYIFNFQIFEKINQKQSWSRKITGQEFRCLMIPKTSWLNSLKRRQPISKFGVTEWVIRLVCQGWEKVECRNSSSRIIFD